MNGTTVQPEVEIFQISKKDFSIDHTVYVFLSLSFT